MWNALVEDITGNKDSGVTGAVIKDTISGETKNIRIVMGFLWQLDTYPIQQSFRVNWI